MSIYDDANKFNFTYDGRTMVLAGVNDTLAIVLRVPPKYNGIAIEGIGNGAFMSCSRLRHIVLPDTVKFIESSAFKGCSELREAELSAELHSIGAFAFEDCKELRKITISYHTIRHDVNSFRGCINMRSVDVKCGEGNRRNFMIATENEQAIWLYLRAVTSATDPRNGYMDKYDATFLEVRDETDRYYIAVSRLNNPFELTSEMKKIYHDALNGMIWNIIGEDRVDRLTMLGQLNCIDEENLCAYVDYAGRIGGGCIAYLLDYQQKSGRLDRHDFSL